jgi:hypothetical protein
LASQINASNSGFGGIVSTGDSSGVLQLQAAGTTIATIQSTGLNLGSNGVVFSDASIQTAAASPYVLKNRIINGDMRIDQRNAGASYNVQGGEYSVDRWATNATQTSKFSAQQNAGSVTPPTGYSYYLGLTSTAATTVGASDIFNIAQYIEGFNFADLNWGTANAQTVTISFWVRSSLTGTFGGALTNSGVTRSYPFSYTISAANTWEQKTITITGDTTGTWVGATNGIGVRTYFSLGTGSTRASTAGAWAAGDYRTATGATNVVSTNGATFYITGVQLEQNTSATPFERRLYGTELALCERYYQILGTVNSALGFASYMNAGDTAYTTYTYHTVMRATPSGVYNMQTPTNATVSFTLGSDSIRHVLTPGSTGRTASAGDTNAIRLSAEL